jgi:outer membrane protein assembly factor BamE (lipoprotein component of BamABCDE complex)
MKTGKMLIGAAAVTAAAIVGGQMTVATSAAFDSAAWKAEAGNRKAKNPRGAMVADVEKALRPAMSRQEVEALLGRPDEFYRLHIYGAPASGAALHAKAVRFGPDGKVAKGSNNIARDVSGDGMTPKQVAAVIGEPSEIRDDYVYNVGTSSYGLDPVYLHVEFDESGALVRHFREQG